VTDRIGFEGRSAVYQVAYTVGDVRASAAAWSALHGIGPWFLRGPFLASGARYRGAPNTATFSVARAFSEGLMIELIQQHDLEPSVYRERIDRSGFGFHHVAQLVDDIDAACRDALRLGGEVVFEDLLPSGSRVVFVDPGDALPGMVELVERTRAQTMLLDRMRAAAAAWDGADPIRED